MSLMSRPYRRLASSSTPFQIKDPVLPPSCVLLPAGAALAASFLLRPNNRSSSESNSPKIGDSNEIYHAETCHEEKGGWNIFRALPLKGRWL